MLPGFYQIEVWESWDQQKLRDLKIKLSFFYGSDIFEDISG